MLNFTYYIPTKIFFGKGMLHHLPEEIPAHSKILLTYGGGSIKLNGIYEKVVSALKDFTVIEFGGIKENPDVYYLEKGLKLAKEHQVDWIVAIGGGSVIDASKFLAGAYYLEDNAWDIVSKKIPINKALPLSTVLTLPATSTEMNHIGVLSNYQTKEKFSFRSDKLFPSFTIIDPEFTYSLSKTQLAYGICDAFMHVMEQYINDTTDALIQDRFSESILKTLLYEGPKAIKLDSPDYTNRANLAWAQSWSLNGMIQMGIKTDLATHKVGHELTALYGITHAPSLIVVYPSVLRMIKNIRPEKLKLYATNVLGINEPEDDCLMNQAIEKTIEFFNTMGISHCFKDYLLPLEAIDVITDRFLSRGWKFIGNMQDINVEDLAQQLKTDQSQIQ